MGDSTSSFPRNGRLTEPGSTIGRYIVLHKLGHGAMGVVLAAYDPDLDRKLAIKVVRPDPLGMDPGETEQKRLLREAQAMASLAHPNVVTVYDVGTVDDRVFIAMEYLDAETAGRWLEGDPPREAILEVFQAAGRGLAAAHRAGLVHRDFKLENVLVARDGRVKVMDFGLARPLPSDPTTLTTPRIQADELPSTPADSASGGTGRLLETSLTEAGAVAGTPSYIAPECLRGQPATPLSDQFSFCVALYRALYREYPFPRRSIMELLVRGHGPLRDPPLDSRVPFWLRAILVRGLSERPEDRFPSMEALLEALTRDPARKRRRLLLGVAASAAALALGAGIVFMARQPSLRCEGAAAAMDRVWNDEVRERLLEAFLETGSPVAEGSWKRVTEALTSYADAWKAMRVEACRATRVTGEQSEELLDLRMACLDTRLQEMSTILEHLASPDQELVARAPRAVLDLSGLETCADSTALTAPVPPPRDPVVREQVRELRRSLAVVRGTWLTGNVESSLRMAGRIVARAKKLDYAPLLAEALVLTGRIEEYAQRLEDARNHLLGGLEEALSGGHDTAAVQALIGLIWLDGNDTFDFPRAWTWARLAGAILERLPGEQDLALELANALGSAHQAAGKVEEAMEQHRRALELAERLHGPESYFVARTLANMGNVELVRGDFHAAVELLERVVPLMRRHLGPSINLATGENSLASALQEVGRLTEARRHYREARRLYVATVGEGNPWTAVVDLNLVQLDVTQGRCAGALDRLAEIEEIFTAAFPPGHPFFGYLDFARGSALLCLGEPARALPYLERTWATRSSSGNPVPYEAAQAAFALARARWATGRHREALRLARQAEELLRTLPGRPIPFQETVTTWLRTHGG